MVVLNYLNVLIPIFSLAINILTQIIAVRYIPNLGLLNSLFLGFGFGMLSLFICEIYIFSVLLMGVINFIIIFSTNIIIYACLGYCYFHFINLGETARRIRILRELYDKKTGLSEREILDRYNAKEIIEKRIDRLIDNRQIIFKNGRYYIGSRALLWVAKIIVIIRLIILGKRSKNERIYFKV